MNKQLISLSFIFGFVLFLGACSLNGYYINDDGRLEGRFLEEGDVSTSHRASGITNQPPGKVRKEIAFSHSDVEGILIEGEVVAIFFRRDSWAKIYDATANNTREWLGFVIDDEIVTNAVIMEPLYYSAQLRDLDEKVKRRILSQFRKASTPSPLPPTIEEEVALYENLVRIRPDDWQVKERLASLFAYEHSPPLCEKAIPLYEDNLTSEANKYTTRINLGRCYLALGRFSEAHKILDTLFTSSETENKWKLHRLRGGVYQLEGKPTKAIKEYELAIEHLMPLKKAIGYRTPDMQDIKRIDLRNLSKDDAKKRLMENFGLYKLDIEEEINRLKERIEMIRKSVDERNSTD